MKSETTSVFIVASEGKFFGGPNPRSVTSGGAGDLMVRRKSRAIIVDDATVESRQIPDRTGSGGAPCGMSLGGLNYDNAFSLTRYRNQLDAMVYAFFGETMLLPRAARTLDRRGLTCGRRLVVQGLLEPFVLASPGHTRSA
jgi:hypothetical protein